MKNRLLLIGLLIFISVITAFAQSISIPITISDNAVSPNSQILYLGVDTSATDGIDLGLGETELPPMPPTGNFEARLLLPSFSGSLASRIDYRYGTKMQTGETEYRLRYQKHTSASSINIGWELPANAIGELKDAATDGVIINVTMQGSGSFTVTNPSAFNQLKLYITYTSLSFPVTISDNATIPNSSTLYFGLHPEATDGIDLDLGESELPPMPPSGNFEARMLLPAFSGAIASYKDFRNGTSFTNDAYEYRLRYQKHSSATSITIAWSLPSNLIGVIKDVATNGVVINVTMLGSGSYTVTNPNSFNQVKMLVNRKTEPILDFPLTISDNAANPNSTTLFFGLHPEATDGVDLDLGESELPPMPPSGNFEARMILPEFSGALASIKDYRNGSSLQNGTYEYRLRYQKHATATNISITWNLPANITGVLKDVATNGVVINVNMDGSGSYIVTNPNSFNQLKMYITYNLGSINLSVKAVPEGYYNATLNRLNISDTFKVYLASSISPNAFVDSSGIVLDSVTFSGTASFFNAPSGTYYLVIKGNNVIQTWSKTGGESFAKGQVYTYNFDSVQTQAYGGNLKLVNSHWCLYSGDVNQDEVVDFSDLMLVDQDSYNFTSGYVRTDINGDLYVDFSDLTLVDNNSFNFIAVIRP